MLEITTRKINDVIIVDCRGKIVLGNETGNLRDLAKGLMSQTKHIVLNLSEVTHIDSNGIGTLFGMYVTTEQCGVKLHLAGLGKYTKSVTEITKLTMFIPEFPTVEQAIGAFAGEVAAARP